MVSDTDSFHIRKTLHVCPFTLEKRRVAGNGMGRELLKHGKEVNRDCLPSLPV